jgi:hypothetical protein
VRFYVSFSRTEGFGSGMKGIHLTPTLSKGEGERRRMQSFLLYKLYELYKLSTLFLSWQERKKIEFFKHNYKLFSLRNIFAKSRKKD